jgi:outer membrane protein OmpA-like peptidoglycan-associated protein
MLESLRRGDDRFADLFEVVAEGGEAFDAAKIGDVIIGAPLFPEVSPRIEIVSAPIGWQEWQESHTAQAEDVVLLRPLATESTGAGFQENPAAIAGAAAAAGSLLNVGRSAVDLSRGVTQLQRDRLALANEQIDFAMRVASIGNQIRRSLRGLRFSSQPATLQSQSYTPPNAETRNAVWEFTVRCRYPDDDDAARYTFRVNVQYDCFNIIEARVTFGTFDLGGFTVKSHMLSIDFAPQTRQFRAAFPGEMRFAVSGRWDPADLLGRIAEELSFAVIVRADGSVRLSGTGGGLVQVFPARRVGGSPRFACRQLYSALQGSQAPASVSNEQPAAPGRRPRGGGGGQRQSHPSPLPRDPHNGKHIFFRHGGATITDVHRTRVRNWWTSLSQHLQQAIASGQAHVTVNGHADPTGDDRRNIALSGQRAANVAALVRELAGTNARIDYRGVGSQLAIQSGARGRDPNWRRATIRLGGM